MLSIKLREYLKDTKEKKQALDPNLRKQYDFQIRRKVEEAMSDFLLLISSHSEDQLEKIFTDEIVEAIFKLREKAMATWYLKGIEYEVEVKLKSGEIVRVKRGGEIGKIDTRKRGLIEEQADADIDALVVDPIQRKMLKKSIRCPDELIDFLESSLDSQLFQLSSDYSKGQITEEEYTERLKAIRTKSKWLKGEDTS